MVRVKGATNVVPIQVDNEQGKAKEPLEPANRLVPLGPIEVIARGGVIEGNRAVDVVEEAIRAKGRLRAWWLRVRNQWLQFRKR